jgi:uncharacterized protein (TIGR02284 family)
MSGTHNHDLVACLNVYTHEGQYFYATAASEVKDLALASTFREMSGTRWKVSLELDTYLAAGAYCSSDLDNQVSSIVQLYKQLRDQLAEMSVPHLLSELEPVEADVLRLFSLRVRDLSDRELADMLAMHLASLQVTHDCMRSLKLECEQ